jgi:hypothetical protein
LLGGFLVFQTLRRKRHEVPPETMELNIMHRYLFRDEAQAFDAKIRREGFLKRAAEAYYLNTDSGNPRFEQLTPEEQEQWVRRVTSGE